jgi:formylglycine-generating enzyme required for sulfatase activity
VTGADGKPVEITATAGQELVVSKQGFRAATRKLTLNPGSPNELTVKLEPLVAKGPEAKVPPPNVEQVKSKEVPQPPQAGAKTEIVPPSVPPRAPVPASDSVPSPAPAGKTLTADLGGGVTMEFVRIPAGSFTMGSPKAEKDAFARNAKRDGYDTKITNEDDHHVTISKDFYLAKYPVTQEQYQALVGDNPSQFRAGGYKAHAVQGLDTSRFPVENVSWDMATKYCEQLTQRDGRRTFRLPTEAEWEYACRGGTQTAFYWGDKLNGTQANVNGTGPFGSDARGPYKERPTPVGIYEGTYPHPWGLCDMHGNVVQWCADAYEADYSKISTNVDPWNQRGNERVSRGGSWIRGCRNCRAASRSYGAPSDRTSRLGFRVLCRVD